ncbi:HAUS augmin-like complex subunit 2 [Rhineura floridana]|uniref:HAUS augmin-like complex subunit 2 n=1 Tax=Rhineura floridana TaxID=261503 RepID=UPI002AC85090|nr:HAUS augmin-like complex subunit 2 [Rhineura floridana]XP_061467276.1 HAUS augmin-like complex subunit 2 [Rhineura floridana]
MASSNPWDAVQPSAAGLLLTRCLSAGVVSQEAVDICGKPAPCFVHLSEAEQVADLQAELSQIKLDTEILQMEKDTADVTHPFYLTQKCQALQVMNRHLEAVLKEKRTLRQRLVKPLCQESLPIEAAFHRHAVELLAVAVAFIENLEIHLNAVRSIPQIPLTMKNMDSALAKIDLLVTETEELAEHIMVWREKQKGIFSDNSQLTVGSDSWFKSISLQ